MTAKDNPFAFLWVSPEFDQLAALLARDWEFSPYFGPSGELDRIAAARVWGTEGQVDALRIKSQTDAAAMRADAYGGLLWEKDGTVKDVLAALLELPSPSHPLAPQLVRGKAPLTLD